MPGSRQRYCVYLTEENLSALTHLAQSYMEPYAEVLRARVLLFSHKHPDWNITQIADRLGCTPSTVKKFRLRWVAEGSLKNHPRSGAPRKYQASLRTQITALACSKPSDHGKPWKRWSSGKLIKVVREEHISDSLSRGTIIRWLREDKIKPWRYHLWQKPTDPHFLEKAVPVLDLYEKASSLAQEGEAVVCIDEKTSIQARKPVHETKPAVAEHPVHVASRYERKGALQLFCALIVTSGLTFARTYVRKRFSEFKSFLLELFASTAMKGLKVLDLILDNGSTHAPKQLANWIGTLHLSFDVRILWLPTYASWLDQVEIVFSKLTRDALTPNDFEDTEDLRRTLMLYFDDLNKHPKPIKWTYTKTKLLIKFGSHPPPQMAA